MYTYTHLVYTFLLLSVSSFLTLDFFMSHHINSSLLWLYPSLPHLTIPTTSLNWVRRLSPGLPYQEEFILIIVSHSNESTNAYLWKRMAGKKEDYWRKRNEIKKWDRRPSSQILVIYLSKNIHVFIYLWQTLWDIHATNTWYFSLFNISRKNWRISLWSG